MNDTTRRFLNAIVEKVPTGGTIVELRLFPAIRQGGVESGVAVVALETPELVIADVAASGDEDALRGEALDLAAESEAEVVTSADDVDVPLAAEATDATESVQDAVEMLEVLEAAAHDEGDAAAAAMDDADATVTVDIAEVVEFAAQDGAGDTIDATAEVTPDLMAPDADAESPSGSAPGDAIFAADGDDDSPYAPDVAPSSADEVVLELQDSPALPFKRFAILTARYRLVFKGPDRGKWEMEVTHEADAPLATVERVARGVAKRAGEENEPEHFSAVSLRTALDAPAWVSAT